MENNRITAAAGPQAGEVTTFYASMAALPRSAVLTTMAALLAEGARRQAPVLMIDWDLEAPACTIISAARREPTGTGLRILCRLLELLRCACTRARAAAARRAQGSGAGAPVRRASAADLELRAPARCSRRSTGSLHRTGRRQPPAVPDARRPLRRQLRRARRPARLGRPVLRLPGAVPQLRRPPDAALRPRADRLPQRPLGRRQRLHRSAAGQDGRPVHARTAQPGRPCRAWCARALDYRCSHEDEQRPLLVYPLPSARTAPAPSRRLRWRHRRCPARRSGRLPGRAGTVAGRLLRPVQRSRSTAISTKCSCRS